MDGAEEAQLVGSLSARAFSALTPRAYQRIASAPPPSSNTFLRNQPWRNQRWSPPRGASLRHCGDRLRDNA